MRDAQRAGSVTTYPAADDAQRCPALSPFIHQAVDHLIHGAIATDSYYQLISIGHCLTSQLDPMSHPLGEVIVEGEAGVPEQLADVGPPLPRDSTPRDWIDNYLSVSHGLTQIQGLLDGAELGSKLNGGLSILDSRIWVLKPSASDDANHLFALEADTLSRHLYQTGHRGG